jgi:ABC-2 type transport system permease protein
MILWMLYRRWQRRRAARLAATAPQQTQSQRRANPTRSPRNDSALSLVLHQARFDLLALMRNRQGRFFTLVLPVLFLVIFTGVFGNDHIGPNAVRAATYYVPGIVALGIIAASFVNLVISVTTEREQGILKRRRATPVPAWVLVAGRALSAVTVSLATVAVLLTVGRLAYGVQLPTSTIPAVLLTALLGAVTFCVLGYALTTAITSADSAQPVVQAVMLPLYFISGVFIPQVQLPAWLAHVAQVFPVQHLAAALHTAFDPAVQGSGFVWTDLGVLALWAAAGLLIALRRFSWVPAAARA